MMIGDDVTEGGTRGRKARPAQGKRILPFAPMANTHFRPAEAAIEDAIIELTFLT
jgi:hypothetical protein